VSLRPDTGKGVIVRLDIALAVLLGFVLCSCGQPDKHSEEELSDKHINMVGAHTEYDRFRDQTDNSSAACKVAGSLFLGFSYSCHGNSTECRPQFVEVEFWSGSPKQYTDSHDVIFLADGTRISSPADFPKQQWHSLDGGLEMLLLPLETDDFLKLIHAHSVEGRLGANTEFTISDSDLQKWRTFAVGVQSGKHPKQKP
jgi:hypothetical protein